MEITLLGQDAAQVAVLCDGQPSHTFDLLQLIPDDSVEGSAPQPLLEPVEYGKRVFEALFPAGSPAQQFLDAEPDRVLLVAADDAVQAIPWEYAYGPDGFIVREYPFVRGIPAEQRIDPPALSTGLHIVAIPSNPLDPHVPPLDIEGEWLRLQEGIEAVPQAITLERTRPATLEQLRRLVANQRNRIIHFMGHGAKHESGALLCFENQYGALEPVTAKDFMKEVRGTVFLVTLNACVSAKPGKTPFNNLAAALVQRKVPYALGMRFSILDEDARTFSRIFYNELARGSSVEEATFSARRQLAKSPRTWAVGVPVLYTALKAPAAGFVSIEGQPTVVEHQPKLDIAGLPRAEGAFQGRVGELQALGEALTSDSRPRIITIHGGGGQGKTALAREAVERFAHAWPGGVWATTLESLPTRETFVGDLARFLGLAIDDAEDPAVLERRVLNTLGQRRTLIVLDNAETLIGAVEAGNEQATRLAELIRDHVPGPRVSILATSRYHIGWSGEATLDLGGLTDSEGAALFRQSAPQRTSEIDMGLAETLSDKVDGHPLSLRLLGGAFNESGGISLQTFVERHQEVLVKAEDKYRGIDHRHRTLYASIDTSVRYLSDDLRNLLSGLWIFRTSFLPETAAEIFDEAEYEEEEESPVYNQLYTLWRRGLLVRETFTMRDGSLLLYRLLPTVRPYAEQFLPQAYEKTTILARYGAVYTQLTRLIYQQLDSSTIAVFLAGHLRDDLDHVLEYLNRDLQGWHYLYRGWTIQRLGDRKQGLAFTEQALELAQGTNQQMELQALNNLALVYQAIGQPHRALELLEQTLPIMRAVGDQDGEATTLNNLALVYQAIGQPQRALELYQRALPIRRDVGGRAGEATTLNNMAGVYQAIGQPARALELFEQALPIMRDLSDRAGEAATLNNMAGVYQAIGQPARALELFEQALPIMRDLSDRAGEATTLNNMAGVYQAIGQLERALKLYQQALRMLRDVGNRAVEANSLNNMAGLYKTIGQTQPALELYEQALSIHREVGNRAGEAATLNGIAYLFIDLHQYDEAQVAYEDSIVLAHQVEHPAGEAAGLVGLSILLYQHLDHPDEAIARLDQAITVLTDTGLDRTAAGQTIDQLQQMVATMRAGVPFGNTDGNSATMPPAQIELVVNNTIAVMTVGADRREEWRADVTKALHEAQEQGANWQIEVEFFTAVLAILDQQTPHLPEDHPYAAAITAIQAGIAAGGPPSGGVTAEVMQAVAAFVNADSWEESRRVVEAQQNLLLQPPVETLFEQNIANAQAAGDTNAVRILERHLAILRDCRQNGIAAAFEKIEAAQNVTLPFDAEIIPRTVEALLGTPQDKMAHMQYLSAQAAQVGDADTQAFFMAIQTALFGGDLEQAGQNLTGIYQQAWAAIALGVQTGGVDPRMLELIVQNTVDVFGTAADRRSEWRTAVVGMREQATADGEQQLVALLDAVSGLLDANGNATGLGGELQGIYQEVWQAIVQRLPQV